jgi:N-hydroxyarylamine O-acetyltransferase
VCEHTIGGGRLADNKVMNVEKYLARIGMDRIGVVPDFAGLKMLQRQHLLNVPFENLDIHWRRPIVLDVDSFYQKIVEHNRGGFCYELNGLFNHLLRDLGFETRLLSARVAMSEGTFTPEYDHAAILVIIGEMQYLADVGFGSFAAEPLQLVPDMEQADSAGRFMIRKYDDEYFEVAIQQDFGWKSEYIFKPLGHDLAEFEDQCNWNQTSPDSHFTKGRLCSLMTENGRKTLTDDRFILTEGRDRTETSIISADEFESVLFTQFGITKSGISPDYSRADQYIN